MATLGAGHLNQDNTEHKLQHRFFKFICLHWQLCISALEDTCIILENSTPLLLIIKDITEFESIQFNYLATNQILHIHYSKCIRDAFIKIFIFVCLLCEIMCSFMCSTVWNGKGKLLVKCCPSLAYNSNFYFYIPYFM